MINKMHDATMRILCLIRLPAMGPIKHDLSVSSTFAVSEYIPEYFHKQEI